MEDRAVHLRQDVYGTDRLDGAGGPPALGKGAALDAGNADGDLGDGPDPGSGPHPTVAASSATRLGGDMAVPHWGCILVRDIR
jgi:hypothetical protein